MAIASTAALPRGTKLRTADISCSHIDNAETRGKAHSCDCGLAQLEQAVNATERRAWLTIGIPTVPRKTGADYLTLTLESLLEELPLDKSDPLYGRVRVLVMNNRPGNHTVFYKVRQWSSLLVIARFNSARQTAGAGNTNT